MAVKDMIVEYQIEDDNGLVAPITIYALVDTSKTIAELQTELDIWTPLIAAVTDGAQKQLNVTLHMSVNAGNANPVAESNIQEGGLLTFNQANIKYPDSIFIPAFKDSLAVQGKIDNTGDTAALVTVLSTSPHGGVSVTSKFLNVYASFLRGRTTFRRFARKLALAASGRHHV
jgi:hypothetical protein